jgi:DNA topoisomerase-6 subunit B
MKTVADELFKEFREHSVSEFFRKNAAMLGYTGKIRSLTTIVHEGVTNSIDAAEEAGVLPKVYVAIKNVDSNPEHLKVVIEDNASGIPEQYIPDVFGKMLAGTKLHRHMQQRGQQGIGIAGACMFSQITSGKPVTVTTSTGNGEITQMSVMIDVDRNEGKVLRREKFRGKWRGTRVELEARDVAYMRSRYGPFNYLRMTAIANPHVHITFIEPDGVMTVFENATDRVPERPRPMPLHPWGAMADDILTLAKRTKARSVATFLSTELSRVSKKKAEEVCRVAGVPQEKRPLDLTWEDAERIVAAFKQVKLLAPPTSGLRPIGAQDIEKGMRQILNPEFMHVITRPPKVYRGGLPFIVEAGIAYGGNAGKPVEGKNSDEEAGETEMDIIRFANRAPLIFDQGGCAITMAAKSIDWRRYGVDPESSPITLFVNVSSAYVPYTSAGKQSIADEPEIIEEIRAAIMEVARELRKYLYRKIRSKERQERAGIFERYLPVIARKAARLAGAEEPDIKPLLRKITGVNHAGEGQA